MSSRVFRSSFYCLILDAATPQIRTCGHAVETLSWQPANDGLLSGVSAGSKIANCKVRGTAVPTRMSEHPLRRSTNSVRTLVDNEEDRLEVVVAGTVTALPTTATQNLRQMGLGPQQPQQQHQQQHPSRRGTRMSRANHHHCKSNRQLRKIVRTTPWRDAWELQAVGRAMLSVLAMEEKHDHESECPRNVVAAVNNSVVRSDGSCRPSRMMMTPAQAFELVSIWKTRLNAQEGLPHAVESTGALAQIFWRDSLQRQQQQQRQAPGVVAAASPQHSASCRAGLVSAVELRLAYSAAVIRCVNGFADTLQQQRFVAASVASLCQQLGIPTWIVDIRHEASHNALPTLELLRLAATTLLEFMRAEYWIPSCPDWHGIHEQLGTSAGISHVNEPSPGGRNLIQDGGDRPRSAIDLLLDYKASTSSSRTSNSNPSSRSSSAEGVGAEGSTARAHPSSYKRKRQLAAGPTKTTMLSYDPLFGEFRDATSSDEGSDDDNADYDSEDPVLGSIRGSYVGTNTNRFAILQAPTVKRKKVEHLEDTKPSKRRKQKSENSPLGYAKAFVRSVSPLVGYDVALRFLVWGGVGGTPAGRGVLIPGSEKAFPATSQGVEKSWGRYSPLLTVICRMWPGFCSSLLVHLVDFVLSIEDSVVEQSNLDAGSARKLYFLSSWIRLILSQRFVGALDPTFFVKSGGQSTRKTVGNPTELACAQLEHLEILGYPLNSIEDRCCQHHCNNANSPEAFLRTSHDLRGRVEKILGPQWVPNFGFNGVPSNDALSNRSDITISDSPAGEKDTTEAERSERPPGSEPNCRDISLAQMEALLSGEDEQNGTMRSIGDCKMDVGKTGEDGSRTIRPAWVQCQLWDPCALGTLPGYPA
jgi:Las1-like